MIAGTVVVNRDDGDLHSVRVNKEMSMNLTPSELEEDFLQALDFWGTARVGINVHEVYETLWRGRIPSIIAYPAAMRGQISLQCRDRLDEICCRLQEPRQFEQRLQELRLNVPVAQREQLRLTLSGLCHGIRAAARVADLLVRDMPLLLPEEESAARVDLENCFDAYHRAWRLFGTPFAVIQGTSIRQPSADPVIHLLNLFVEPYSTRPVPNWLNQATWLIVRRLLSAILQTAEEVRLDDVPNPIRLMLVDGPDIEQQYRGLTATARAEIFREGAPALYFDPVSCGVTLFDEELLESVRIAGRIAWPELTRRFPQTDVGLRLSLDLSDSGIDLLCGESAGGILAVASAAAAQGKRVSRFATASFSVRMTDAAKNRASHTPLMPDDIELSPVDSRTIRAKLHAEELRNLGVDTIYLHPNQELASGERMLQWGEWVGPVVQSTGLQIRPVKSLSQAFDGLTLDEGDEKVLKQYLTWVISMHRTLELPGVRGAVQLPIPLEQVYVALRGHQGGAFEIAMAHQSLEDDLRDMNDRYAELPESERRQLRQSILRSNPYMLSMRDRDRSQVIDELVPTPTITLGDAFRMERQLVILGDPGSGKSTLGRWLSLRLAQTMDQHGAGSEVNVPTFQVDPEAPYDPRLLNLGPARVPILVRVAKFAQALAQASESGTSLLLIDWLCKVNWNEHPPSSGERIPEVDLDRLFRKLLKRGQVVLILDGLDEITEATDRADIVRAIDRFVSDWIPASESFAVQGLGGGSMAARGLFKSRTGRPCEVGGNQLVVTSRIAGYHDAPLTSSNPTHVTIEPMQRTAVEHFCNIWMREAYRILYPQRASAEVQKEARETADGLKVAIFDPDRPGVAEIASNPLLVTILASLFLNDRKLPGSRVELYQKTIEMLIADWRDTGLSLDEALYVLQPLAEFIHKNDPRGFVEEPDLREVVGQHLAVYRKTRPDDPSLESAVRQFVVSLEQQVGLIASRAESLFGFLHLTFQEYLAGRHLVANPVTAAHAIAERLNDPRWREPIVLGLGYAMWKWTTNQRQNLIEQLLKIDDPLGAFVPRMALLIVDALSGMKGLSSSSQGLLVRQLLLAYADRKSCQRFPALRQRIEDAFLRLRDRGDPTGMDEILSETIRTPRARGMVGAASPIHSAGGTSATGVIAAPSLAAAAAAIVRVHEWFTPTNVEALVESLENDDESWDWPIEQCLRDLVSPELPPVIPKPYAADSELQVIEAKLRNLDAQPATSETEGTRRKLLRDLDNARQVLDDIRLGKPREYRRLRDRYTVALAAAQRHALRESLRVRSPLNSLEMRLRRALENDSSLLDQVHGDYRWMSVLAGLNGGYANCRADLIDREYRDLAAFLQKSDDERESEIDANPESFAGKFGGDDLIYTTAVYLDVGMAGRQELAQMSVKFSPDAMHRSSHLDGMMLSALRDRVPVTELHSRLRQAVREAGNAREKADAYIALIGIGENVSEDILMLWNDPARRSEAEAILNQFRRVKRFLEEPVYRGRTRVLKDLTQLDPNDQDSWIAIVDTVLTTLCGTCDVPIRIYRHSKGAGLSSELADIAPPEYQAVARADIFYTLFNETDDRVYHSAIALDSIQSAEQFIPLLLNAHRAPNRLSERLPLKWPVEAVPPRDDGNSQDIPIHALQALTTLHLSDIRPEFEVGLLETVVGKLSSRLNSNLELWPELWLTMLASGAFEFVTTMGHQEVRVEIPLESLSATLDRLTIPYHRARGWMAAIPLLVGQDRGIAYGKARAATELIYEPQHREAVLERLLPLADDQERPELLESALRVAREIADPDNRCRALVRLSRWTTNEALSDVWCTILESAGQIAQPGRRSETLALIKPWLPAGKELHRQWQKTIFSLPTSFLRAHANCATGLHLLREQPSAFKAVVDANPQVWAPLLLSAGLQDILKLFRLDQSPATLWRKLIEKPHDKTAALELANLGAAEGLVLTREAASAVHAMLAVDEMESLHLLMPLLQSPVPEAVSLVERWRQLADPFVANHATLIIAEDGLKLTTQVLPALVWQLSQGPDRSRLRAQLVLSSRVWGLNEIKPQLSVARLGRPLFDALAQVHLDWQERDPRVSSVPVTMTGNILVDDPLTLKKWIADADGKSQQARVARFRLSNILHCSEDVWPVLLEGLAYGPTEARLALAESLCMNSGIKEHLSNSDISQMLKTIRAMSLDDYEHVQVSYQPEVDIVTALFTVAEKASDTQSPKESLDAALASQTISLAALFRTADDQELLLSLKELGLRFFIWLDGVDREAEESATQIIGKPETFPLLLKWLVASLERDLPEREWIPLTVWLLRITAEAVRRMPDAFVAAVKADDPHRIETLLVKAATGMRHGYARRSAIILLSHLRHVSAKVVEAMLFAMRSDRHSQDAAIESAGRFIEFRTSSLAKLITALDDPSAVVASGAARMLVAVCRNETMTLEQRNRILEALVQAAQRWQAQRGIYRFVGNGDNQDNAVRTGYFGRLDQVFHQAILEITGLISVNTRSRAKHAH